MSAPGLLGSALLLLFQGRVGVDPRSIVLRATRAVEGDSLPTVVPGWTARLHQDSADREAALGLATVARLTYRYPEATSLYRLILDRPAAAIDRWRVYARLGSAYALSVRVSVQGADSLYAQAASEAHQLGDSAAEAEALIGRAVSTERAAGGAAAQQFFARARALIPSTDLPLRARLDCEHAQSPTSRSVADEREEDSLGERLAAQAFEPRVHAGCLLALSGLQFRLHQMDSAMILSAQAAGEERAIHDSWDLATTLQWRGYTWATEGQYGLARRELLASVSAGRLSRNDRAVASALLHLALGALRFGDVTSGLEFSAQAESLLSVQGDEVRMATLRGVQGDLARAAGDTARARAAYEDAVRRVAPFGGYPTLFPHRQLAGLALSAGHWAAAERELRAARAIAHELEIPTWEQRLAYDFATLKLGRRELVGAERDFKTYLRTLGPKARNRGYAARARLAEIYALRGDNSEAEAELTAAADMLDAERAGLEDRELRLLVFQTREDDLDPDHGVSTTLARLAMDGRVASAFQLVERQRARELLDQLVRFETARGDSAELHPGLETRVRSPSPLTASALVAALPDDRTAVLEYLTGRRGAPTTLFVVTRTGIRSVALPPIDSIAEDITRFVTLLQDGSDAWPLAARLGGAVLAPALDGLPSGVDRLVLVPDDVLHRLPFDALVLPDGRRVVERFATSLAPSATVAVRLWRRAPATGPAALLAIGDPLFPRETDPAAGAATLVLRSAFDAQGGLPRLVGSAREARTVARYAPRADVRLRAAASAAYLKHSALDGYRVIHFATHALVSERVLTRTALALSPGDGEDGFVSPADLAALRLNADLVVLSACRTAGGVIVGGEGVQGLTAPLLEAGARSVVATQWSIGDRATLRLVEAFYRGLAERRPAGDALRTAKLAALHAGIPVREWAAFTIVGDPLVRVPLRLPPPRWPWWVGLVTLLVVAGYGLWRLNRSHARGVERGR